MNGELFISCRRYKAKGSDLMGPDELQRFLRREQNEMNSLEECQELITALTQDSNKVPNSAHLRFI